MLSRRRLAKTDGNYNYTSTWIGLQGAGKTQASVRDAMAFQRFPAIVLVHDIQGRIPKALHDGTPTGITRYQSAAAAIDGIKKAPFSRLHAIDLPDAMDVIGIAHQLSEASKKHHGGKFWTPVHVVVDEVAMCKEAKPSTPLGPTLQKRLTNRRHELISYSFSAQSAGMIHHMLLEWSTTICMFRIDSKTAHRRLEGAGVPVDIVGQLEHLPMYTKIVRKK